MAAATVYLKCDRNVEVRVQDVYLRDLGSLHSADGILCAKLKALKVHRFAKDGARRCVISALKLIELMEEACPGITVEVVGEPDVLIQWVSVAKNRMWKLFARAAFVCLVSFFGTAFTIMAYHNDVGINDIFAEIYRICMGREPEGINILEISYSLGLSGGIILFFNHIGGRRITRDPTPIEVAMRTYEKDVDTMLIETAGREGEEIDV